MPTASARAIQADARLDANGLATMAGVRLFPVIFSLHNPAMLV